MLSLLRRTAPPRLKDTSYLDGLRGIASLAVYLHHHTLWTHGPSELTLESSFGFNSQHHLATLPFLRLFFSAGHFAVIIFLVLSGYVLSHRPLRLIREGNKAGLVDALASATFRRWPRLYLPVAVTTLAHMTLSWSGGLKMDGPPLEASWFAAVRVWAREFINFSFVLPLGNAWLRYNIHLWSIPLEMKGSLLVYIVALATSQVPDSSRLVILGGLIWYLLYVVSGWYLAAFLLGMGICQLDLAAQDRRERTAKWDVWRRKPCWAMIVVGLYLGGVPHRRAAADLAANPGWYYFAYLKPSVMGNPTWFFLLIGATLLVASVSGIPKVKQVLESRVCQYLGRISYGLYLCHGPILWTLGDACYKWWQRNLVVGSASSPLALEPWYIMSELSILPFTLLVAELVTVYIDEPSVRLAKYAYALAQGGEKQQSSRWVV